MRASLTFPLVQLTSSVVQSVLLTLRYRLLLTLRYRLLLTLRYHLLLTVL